jgi:hypothetical protein
MKTLIPLAIATGLFIGGCATAQSSNEASGTPSVKPAKEDYVTGSRIPRSESNENYQGAKTMNGRDVQEYMSTVGKQGN